MIGLDNPEWQRLEDAYGSAEGIPNLLQQLFADLTDKKAWNNLWSSLCHQNTIYSASVAVAPHLVSMATNLALNDRLGPLILVGSIAACIGQPPNYVRADSEFSQCCSKALHLLLELVEHGNLTDRNLRYSLSSVAALLGDSKLANVIASLDCYIECPKCGNEIEPLETKFI